jgi:hypothetical protein
MSLVSLISRLIYQDENLLHIKHSRRNQNFQTETSALWDSSHWGKLTVCPQDTHKGYGEAPPPEEEKLMS